MCREMVEIKPKTTPKSPWRRHHREVIKPKLSRKIITSARVNLNCYWSKFEKMPLLDATNANLISTIDNEINENLANEIKELGK